MMRNCCISPKCCFYSPLSSRRRGNPIWWTCNTLVSMCSLFPFPGRLLRQRSTALQKGKSAESLYVNEERGKKTLAGREVRLKSYPLGQNICRRKKNIIFRPNIDGFKIHLVVFTTNLRKIPSDSYHLSGSSITAFFYFHSPSLFLCKQLTPTFVSLSLSLSLSFQVRLTVKTERLHWRRWGKSERERETRKWLCVLLHIVWAVPFLGIYPSIGMCV